MSIFLLTRTQGLGRSRAGSHSWSVLAAEVDGYAADRLLRGIASRTDLTFLVPEELSATLSRLHVVAIRGKELVLLPEHREIQNRGAAHARRLAEAALGEITLKL